MTPPTRQRIPAEERREDVIHAAVGVFARDGLRGASTEELAAQVGVSQPYIFRLFGTKKALFLAAVEYGFDQVAEGFRRAVDADPEDAFKAMGRQYGVLLADRDLLLLQLQAYAACSDSEVRAVVRRRYAQLVEMVRAVTGASPEEVSEFFATGMLMNVVAAMDLPAVLKEEWVQCLMSGVME